MILFYLLAKYQTWVIQIDFTLNQSKSYLFSISSWRVQLQEVLMEQKKTCFFVFETFFFEETCLNIFSKKPILSCSSLMWLLSNLLQFLPGPLLLLSNFLHFFAGTTPAGGSLCPTLCNPVTEENASHLTNNRRLAFSQFGGNSLSN